MSLETFWRVPLDGDGRSISSRLRSRGDYAPSERTSGTFARTGAARDGYNYHDVILRVGRAAELNGFDGLWLPESDEGEDPFIVAASLAREVPKLNLVPSLRPPLLSAVYATKIAVSFQRLTGGRLRWNLTSIDDAAARPWHGRRWSETEQLARISEFLDVAKGFWKQAPFTYQGSYYEVVDGGFAPALQGEQFPVVYLSGTSDEALRLSAKHADVHVFPIAPLGALEQQIARLQSFARVAGRTVGVGVETSLLARHTAEEAWAEAHVQWEEALPAERNRSSDAATTSSRFFESSRVGKHLWSGFHALCGGAPLGLVGGYSELATELGSYADAGIQTFIFGANPHIEEAYRLGEHFLPFLNRSQQRLRDAG